MAKIENVEKVKAALRSKAAKLAKEANVSCVIGYTANYALYVHENRAMKWEGRDRPSDLGEYWGPRGRAGFLLDVMREMKSTLAKIIIQTIKRGESLGMALYMAGLSLQRESQKNVPVEYGHLRASAFTRLEKKS